MEKNVWRHLAGEIDHVSSIKIVGDPVPGVAHMVVSMSTVADIVRAS